MAAPLAGRGRRACLAHAHPQHRDGRRQPGPRRPRGRAARRGARARRRAGRHRPRPGPAASRPRTSCRGRITTALEPDEILTEIRLPTVGRRARVRGIRPDPRQLRHRRGCRARRAGRRADRPRRAGADRGRPDRDPRRRGRSRSWPVRRPMTPRPPRPPKPPSRGSRPPGTCTPARRPGSRWPAPMPGARSAWRSPARRTRGENRDIADVHHPADRQRRPRVADVGAAPTARGLPARGPRFNRYPHRLRAGRLRHLHGAGERGQRPRLHHPRRPGRRRRRSARSRAWPRAASCTRCRTSSAAKQGLQCGFCTPGMLMRAQEILAQNPSPPPSRCARPSPSNLCRCTGYQFITEAVLAAAARMRETKERSPRDHH